MNDAPTRSRSLSPSRLLRTAILFGFALLIAKLFATGEMVKYMSPALDPLTALSGLLLAAMGLIELRGRPDELHEHTSDPAEQAITNLLLLVPLLVGLLFAPRALGASALGGEQISSLLLSFGSEPPPVGRAAPPPAGPIEDIPDLLAYLRQAGELGVGQQVRVVGLVTSSQALGPNELALLRFSIAHCVADARPIGLLVVVPDGTTWPADQWVRVDGTLTSRERDGDRLISIEAETIVPVAEPRNPYLSAT